MANGLTHLPHIQNVTAGRERWDPVYNAIFEVAFTLPDAISSEFAEDALILNEQVTQIDGLNALQKTVQAGSQKFLGVDVSFLNPTLDNTYAELQIQLNLNLRDDKDNYVLKIIKAWGNLGYNMADGTRSLMKRYCSENFRIAEANRDGTIWRSYVFHKVMLTNVDGLNTLQYTSNEAQPLTITLRADWWEEELA